MVIIGLTGGIASGKTVVSDYLKELGYPIVDADELARDIMAPESAVLHRVRAAFGDTVFCDDGTLDRAALGRKVFSDEKARATLDAITHPAIRCLAEKRFGELQAEPLVFFVVPLLYESGMDALCDKVWLVHTDETLRQQRLMKRDGINEGYAAQKMQAQMSEVERLAKAPYVLENNGDKEKLRAQVKKLLKNEKKC